MEIQNKLKSLPPVIVRGKEYLPIIEGGKGIAASNGLSAGSFAAENAIGTFSGVNPDRYDDAGSLLPAIYKGKTRIEKHKELIEMGIDGGIQQAKKAYEVSNGKGRIHINVLWEMGGAEEILRGVLEGSKGLVHGVTCGAGMPYKLGEIAAQHDIDYFPIVSSMRAFRALWKRSYEKTKEFLGGVVYEDPWLAGGHNGLSNSEDPTRPEDPFPRVAELRKFMNEVGLNSVPIIMAGGVWHLKDWEHWLENPEVAPVAFQFGTRPLLTQESPIPKGWKDALLNIKEGDVYLNRFSPTGFYSSAVDNDFIKELKGREQRQVEFAEEEEGYLAVPYAMPPRGRLVYVSPEGAEKIKQYQLEGFTMPMKTPDDTLMFVREHEVREIVQDQIDCMGCLSHCRFSNWKDHDDFTTGKKADPRSFCIQKSLQNIIRGGDVNKNLMFSGHNAYMFGKDPFYANGFIPTVKQLIERIQTGY